MTTSLKNLAIGALLLSLTLPACSPVQNQTGNESSSSPAETSSDPNMQTVLLFFYSKDDLQNATFDHPMMTTRSIPTSDAVNETLKALFAGPTEEERSKGILMSKDLADLKNLYLGVSMNGTTAVVNFGKDALHILNSEAARQGMVKGPIEKTLKQLPQITDVQYAIDGKIFEEWDA